MKKYKIAICGAGSTYTLPMMKTLCDNNHILPLSQIIMLDISEEKLHPIYEVSKILVKEIGVDIEVVEKYEIDEDFTDIDFAFVQIRAGGLEMREQDEKIPLKYGCVGQETCGAGGFAYGMRSVVQVTELFKQIRTFAPKAWIINYSNPAAIVAEATRRIFPDDNRIINLCDMPIAILDGFGEVLKIKRQDLRPRYFGLNHFGWFTHIYDKDGNDLLPIIRGALKQTSLIPEEMKADKGWVHTFEQLSAMVNDFDEYIPNTYLQYYFYPETIVAQSDKEFTRANQVMGDRLQRVVKGCEYVMKTGTIKGTELEKGVHALYIVELASSILNNENREFLAIIQNKGIIPNLPYDAMVEVPCLVGCNGLEPLFVGEIDTFYKGLLENQYAYEKLTVDAVLHSDYNSALKALVLNRTVTDTTKAKLILQDLMEANKEYWTLR